MKELEKSELKKIDGGILPWLTFLAGAAVAGIIADWSGFKTGFIDGLRSN